MKIVLTLPFVIEQQWSWQNQVNEDLRINPAIFCLFLAGLILCFDKRGREIYWNKKKMHKKKLQDPGIQVLACNCVQIAEFLLDSTAFSTLFPSIFN